jgi:hypothetical protein
MPFFHLHAESDNFAHVKVERRAVFVFPDPYLVGIVKSCAVKEQVRRDEDVVEELDTNLDAVLGGAGDLSQHDLAFERAENNQTEFHIHIHQTSAMANETVGGFEQVIEANAKTNLLDDL